MSWEIKPYLRQKGQLCLKDCVLYQSGGWTWKDYNELQLVIPLDYWLEAMHGAYDDVGHLGFEQMPDILYNRFYLPNMEANTNCHVCTCKKGLGFKSKQDKVVLFPLLVTYGPYGLLNYWKPLHQCQHECPGHHRPLYVICESNSNCQSIC